MSGIPLSHVHWNDDELLHRLYGLTASTDGCAECAARLHALRERASALRAAPPVSDEFLRRQRLAIFARLEAGRGAGLAWRAPAAALALLFLAALVAQKPAPVYYEPEIAAVSDAQFFAEIAEAVDRDEPRAAGAIHGLFEGGD